VNFAITSGTLSANLVSEALPVGETMGITWRHLVLALTAVWKFPNFTVPFLIADL
jgi:hypothetical protein